MLETIGYDDAMAGWAAAQDATIGRVVRIDRGVALVLTERGPVRAGYGASVLARMASDSTSAPCTGDWCVLREWPDGRETLEQILPRSSAVVRATAGGQSEGQVLCANVDLVALVIALQPDPALSKVERLLSLAWQSGAQPLVVLTKADLAADASLVAQDIAEVAEGAEVVIASTVSGQGVARLEELIGARHTMALVGSSGHGKSSLANALAGPGVMLTRPIRADGRGRHTSVRRELVLLPGGGAVIDTPGLRGVGLIDAKAGLGRAFGDVHRLASNCRFGDCSHQDEPGCAVRQALTDGDLSLRRFESWQKLQREMVWMASRKDARARAARRRSKRRSARGERP